MNNKSPKISYLSLIHKLWSYLERRRRIQLFSLLFLIVCSAFVDVISIAAVLPFLAVITSPEIIFNNEYFALINQFFNFTKASETVMPLTLLFILLSMLAGGIKLSVIFLTVKIAYSCGSEIKAKIYEKYLNLPYQYHVSANSSNILSVLNHKVQDVSASVIQSILTLVSSLFLIIIIAIPLVFIDPAIGLFTFLLFGFMYGTISLLTIGSVKNNSEVISTQRTKLIKIVQEGAGSIREVILDGLQKIYLKDFTLNDNKLRDAYSFNILTSSVPRFIFEFLGITFLCGISLILFKRGEILTFIPLMGLLALSFQKGLPAANSLYSSWIMINASYHSLYDVTEALALGRMSYEIKANTPNLKFNKNIVLKDLSFNYEGSAHKIFTSINLSITKGIRLGIIGKTGKGKSTLINLLMGLLEPTSGYLLVDGKRLNKKLIGAFQKNIAHVPQNIFILDATVAENIALGIPFDSIDMDRVKLVAKQAEIFTLIESRENGFLEKTGEGGIKFSGGQKQRLGIARALYKNAPILMLDEATSALDIETEKDIIRTISNLNKNLTIIMVTHRLSSIVNSTHIIDLNLKKIVVSRNIKIE